MSNTKANFKPFCCNSSSPESHMASNIFPTESSVGSSEPVQEHTQDSLSKCVPSTSFSKKAESSPAGGSVVPTLEAAGFAAGNNMFPDPTHSLMPTTIEPAATASLPPTIGQRLGKRDEDLRLHKSREVMVNLKTHKLLRNSGSKCYTWHGNLPVKVNRRKDVTVKLYLRPRVSNGSSSPKARLLITAGVKSALLSRLRENGGDCWILVEVEVRDEHEGRRIGYIESLPQAIEVDGDGQVNYDQDLVTCDELAGREGRSESVTLVIKASFVTYQRQIFAHRSRDEDSLVIVEADDT